MILTIGANTTSNLPNENPTKVINEKNNLELDGDIFTQIVSMWKPEEEYFNWHNIWIPIK